MNVWIENPFDNLPAEGCRKQRYWMMAEAFVRAGHCVTYWTSDFSHATKLGRKVTAAEASSPGISVRYIKAPPYRSNVSLARIMNHLAYARGWRSKALAEVERPDIIIASFPTISAAQAAIDIGKRYSARTIIDIQDAWPETFERLAPRGLRLLMQILLLPLKLKAKRVFRAADAVTGVADRYRGISNRDDYYRAYLGIEL